MTSPPSSPSSSSHAESPEARAFSETVDTEAYVPRKACESLLAALMAWRRSGELGATVGALVAPPGLGKTFLLRVFESRLNGPDGGGRALYLPYAGMAVPDLAVWVHGLLGRRPRVPGSHLDDVSAMAALIALGDGPREPFYLLIDDAESMPPATARILATALPPSGSPLRLLLALNDDARATRLLASLDELRPTEFVFRASMTEAETRSYLRGRMAWAGVSEAAIARLERESAQRLHALSGGVPRRLHRLAADLLERQAGSVPPGSGDDSGGATNGWAGR